MGQVAFVNTELTLNMLLFYMPHLKEVAESDLQLRS